MVSMISEIYEEYFIFITKVGGNVHDEQIGTIADHTIEELVGFSCNIY